MLTYGIYDVSIVIKVISIKCQSCPHRRFFADGLGWINITVHSVTSYCRDLGDVRRPSWKTEDKHICTCSYIKHLTHYSTLFYLIYGIVVCNIFISESFHIQSKILFHQTNTKSYDSKLKCWVHNYMFG